MAAIIPDTSNTIFQLAIDLVNQSSRCIFLTGKAGTGKTTFLKYIRENCLKQMAVVAPTGVAAINAGGVTIHSFFQLPLSPFVPEAGGNHDEVINRHSLISRLRITGEKKKVLQELELLIIDEVSMVRCDTVDAIDAVLRHIRHRHTERFGGVQVLFIGDLLQLPPVIKEQEWSLLSPFYDSPFFFDSKVIREEPLLYIEFNKIYRQSDERFIRLLNQVRNNELDEEGIEILEGRFQPLFRRQKQDGYIVLTTHNERARNINATDLQLLESDLYSFKAEIEDQFSENAYPADDNLQLKTGAQVMFIRNDADKRKRYFNGKIGTVARVEEEKIIVRCVDETDDIEVRKEKWENIRYTLNKSSRKLEEEVIGSFTQYPLRLAWAITIHKSQGLTFEKAIIDAGEAFAPGQVYVALSRCTNLQGMILQSKVRSSSLSSDNRISRFTQNSASQDQLQEELQVSKKSYLQKILLSIFDFKEALNEGKDLFEYIREHRSSFNAEAYSWMEELNLKMGKLQDTAIKFHLKLLSLFREAGPEEENSALIERVSAGAVYFKDELELILQAIQSSPAITDSKINAKEFNEGLKEVFGRLAMKKFMMESCRGRIEPAIFQQKRKDFVLPQFKVNAYAGAAEQRTESPHPILVQQLRKLRDHLCLKKDLPIYIVAGSKTIEEMARYLPLSLDELEKVSGFGRVKIESYGAQFLEVIRQYCDKYNLTSRIEDIKPKRQRKESKSAKTDTKKETYRLYREGLSIAGIAKTRSLTAQTIEKHLAYYVQHGEINIEELVSSDKIERITMALNDNDGGSISLLKERLGDSISFGEIHLVIAWTGIKNKGLTR